MQSPGVNTVPGLPIAPTPRPIPEVVVTATKMSGTSDACKQLAQSLGFGPNYSAPSSSPIDDQWSINMGISLAGDFGMGLRGYVGAVGSKAIGGQSVGATMGEMGRGINVIGGLGVVASGYQAVNSYSHNDKPSAALASLDASAGVAAFFPGPDLGAAAYFATRILEDIGSALFAPPSVLERAGRLQAAGCL
jgi:hypothetical protein